MKVRSPLVALIVVVGLVSTFPVGFGLVETRNASASSVIIVDTLQGATPATQFSIFGTGGSPVSAQERVGPRFTLTQSTTITEIGGFLNNCRAIVSGVPQCPETLPFTVEIRPATGGVPDPSVILASFSLSHDNDPLVISYESVTTSLTLMPGSYFALFAAQQDDAGVLLGGAEGYVAGTTTLGLVNTLSGTSNVGEAERAVRILGQTVDIADNFVDLGNPADEAFHNLSGWGDIAPFCCVAASGDDTKRYQTLRSDNSVDLFVPNAGFGYTLSAEVEDGGCTDNFEIFVNGTGPIYSYEGQHPDNPAVLHTVAVPAALIAGTTVTVTFRNTATDSCGLAAVYNVSLTNPTPPPIDTFYFSISAGDTVNGLAIRNEDIVYYDGAGFSLHFDGSDLGLSALVIDAFDLGEMGPDLAPDGPIFMSFTEPATIAGAGLVDDSDIVQFTPTSLGENTAGSFSLFFDGSDIGLTDDGEDIDALDIGDETLFISTTDSFSVTATFTPGGGPIFTRDDEDVFACVDATVGENSACLGAQLAFDGSERGLTSDGEDVDAFAVGDIVETTNYFSTAGSFSVPSLSGPNEDVFNCSALTSCTTFFRFFEGDAHTIAGNISGIDVPVRGSSE